MQATLNQVKQGSERVIPGMAWGAKKLTALHLAERGFTLVELLAVISIIGILAGITAGAVSGLGATGQNAQIQSDTKTMETAADRFFNESFPQVYPVSDPDTNGDGVLDQNDTPPLPAGDVSVRLIDFDARLPQDPTRTFAPDFVKDIPNSASLVSYRVETTTGAIFAAADGAPLIPPAKSRFNVNVLNKATGEPTDLVFELKMSKNHAAVETLKVQIPAGYIFGGESISKNVQVGELEIFFDVDNPWKAGHVLRVAAPILATGRANKWEVSPEYSKARSESNQQFVDTVRGEISLDGLTIVRALGPTLTHTIEISAATTETPGSITIEMDRSSGAQVEHNEARETWILTIFDHPVGEDPNDLVNLTDLVTNPTLAKVYRWITREHSTILVEGIFDQVAGKQAVLIKKSALVGSGGTNVRPSTSSQTVDAELGGATLINLVGTDIDSASLTFSITSLPINGVLTDALNGTVDSVPRQLFGNQVIYTPFKNGADNFTYIVSDGIDDSFEATASITVFGAGNDSYTVNEDTLLDPDAAAGVLANDTIKGVVLADLSAEVVTNPLHAASFTLNGDGSFSYTPTADFNGTDFFIYKAKSGALETNVAIVTITVDPVNDPPVAADDPYSVNEGNILNVAAPGVLGNDTDVSSDPLTAVLFISPANAESFTLNADGSFSYEPKAGFTGPDTFTYKANDGTVDGNEATVTITVNGAPVANDDPDYVISVGVTLDVDVAAGVLANDTDPNGDSLTATLFSDPANAESFTLNADGSFSYEPKSSFTTGFDTFTYKANDGALDSSEVTVTITIP